MPAKLETIVIKVLDRQETDNRRVDIRVVEHFVNDRGRGTRFEKREFRKHGEGWTHGRALGFTMAEVKSIGDNKKTIIKFMSSVYARNIVDEVKNNPKTKYDILDGILEEKGDNNANTGIQ